MTGKKTTLPVHPVPTMTASWQGIALRGLVRTPLQFDLVALEALPQATLVDDFACLEGWSVPGLRWEGPLLRTVIELALPLPAAQYATVSIDDYAVSLPLPDVLAGVGILAIRLNGKLVPVEHGGPARLIVPGEACFTSVKWAEVIELAAESRNTAREIALARLGR